MDIKAYIPVGEANAIKATLILTGGGTVSGEAWLESQSSTEVSVKGVSITGQAMKYAIAVEHIAAIANEQPASAGS